MRASQGPAVDKRHPEQGWPRGSEPFACAVSIQAGRSASEPGSTVGHPAGVPGRLGVSWCGQPAHRWPEMRRGQASFLSITQLRNRGQSGEPVCLSVCLWKLLSHGPAFFPTDGATVCGRWERRDSTPL